MIQLLVEGHGEVEALPVLCRRFFEELQCFDIDLGRPIRRKKSQLLDYGELSKSIGIALEHPDCDGILILFDADGKCPKELISGLRKKASEFAMGKPCEIVIAKQEYESWFLASIASLRGKCRIDANAVYDGDPESPTGAKYRLEEWMAAGYSPRVDQAKLTAIFDMKQAYQKCRSFKRMVKAFGALLPHQGRVIKSWPPSHWIS